MTILIIPKRYLLTLTALVVSFLMIAGAYYFTNGYSMYDLIYTFTPTVSHIESEVKDESIVGYWVAGGNDYQHVEINFSADHKFFISTYYLQNKDKVYNYTGHWKVSNEYSGGSILIMELDQYISYYKTHPMVASQGFDTHMRSYIREGLSILREIDDYYPEVNRLEKGDVVFRWNGVVMHKKSI